MAPKQWLVGICWVAVAVAASMGGALAFDASAHFDLTRDALAAEGFGDSAIRLAQVTNWMCDFYEQAAQNPYSGHADATRTFVGGLVAGAASPAAFEHWPDSAVAAATWLGFDTGPNWIIDGVRRGLDNGEMCEKEWDRLCRAVKASAQARARAGDTQGVLTVLGASLHTVQDFYVHTNWVEPQGDVARDGVDGPGWRARGFGSHPTWFDVPSPVRRTARVYTGDGGPGLRTHGYWNTDGNRYLRTALNKDWPGRPYYPDGYISAYFATRQWARALRLWLGDDAAWRAAQTFETPRPDHLDRDQRGAFNIQFYSGHWQGQGEPSGADAPGPGGSLDDLVRDLLAYHVQRKSIFRAGFEEVVPSITVLDPPNNRATSQVPTTVPMQGEIEFVVVKVTRVRDATGPLEVGIDPGIDEADFYAKARIAGQEFCSGMIHGYDSFDFRLPNYPFTFIKAIPRTWSTDEPVSTLQVRVRTRDELYAGTDDDVFLRVNDRTRFLLDKPLYNDFERGDEDTYSLNPPQDMRVRDLQYLQIEKAPDGVAGGWRLSRVALLLNHREVYYRDRIDTWLEDDHRTWRAPDFKPLAPVTTDVPVTLRLYDSDGGLYGADDHCDIQPDFNRYDLNLLYTRDTGAFRGDISGNRSGSSTGGSNLGGRGSDSDRCEFAFAFETVRVTPPPPALRAAPMRGLERAPSR
jgi:hypothetical protein